MSTPIKHILYPTDFSDNAARALPFALELARHFDAALTILHSIQQTYDFATVADQIRQTSEEHARSMLDELVKDIRQKDAYRQLDIHIRLLHGRTVFSITEESDKVEAGLIVMGRKGATGLKRMFFGSITTELLLHSHTPVLAVPESSTYQGFEHILFTTDFHDGDIRALQNTAEWARSFGSRLTILHVGQEPSLETDIKFRGFRELARETVSYDKMDFTLIPEYSFFSGIAGFLDEHTVSLLVMTRYKKPFFYSMMEQNHSREMGQHAHVPLLVLVGENEQTDWLRPDS